MSYNITFRTETLGTESVEALRAKVLLMQQAYKTASTDVKSSVKAIADAEREAAQAAIAGDQSRARSRQAAAATERAALDGLIAKERELKRALDDVSVSQTRMMSGSMAATSALRELQGGIPTRALGSFLANTLGLGGAFQSLIPIIGIVAGGMELFHLATQKSKESTDAQIQNIHKLTDEIHKLNEEIAGIDDSKFKNLVAGSPGASSGIDAAASEARAAALSGAIALQRQTEAGITAKLRRGGVADNATFGTLSARGANSYYLQLAKDRDETRASAAKLETEQFKYRSQGGLDSSDSLGEAGKDAADRSEKAQRAAEQAARQAEERRRAIDEFGRKELSPVEAIYARRDEAAKRNKFSSDERAQLDAGAERDVQAELKKQEYAQGKDRLSKYESQAHGLDSDQEAGMRRAAELIIAALKQYNAEHNRSVTESGAEAVRASAGRGAFADRMTGLNPQLSDAEKIAEIHRQDLATAQEKYQIELATAAKLATAAEQDDARHKADLANELELQGIKERNIEQLQVLQNKQLEEYGNAVGKLFDALASRRPGAITDLLRSEVMSLGKTITENLAKEIWPTIQKAIPHAAAGSGLGKILQGTPFGPSPEKVALDANTLATQQNTAAMTGNGSTGAGAGAAGGSGTGTGSGGTGSGTSGSGSGFGLNAGTIGLVAAAGAGAFAAISGFKKGGAGGALQGTGAILGTAALFDPEPISKGILAGAALVTGLLGGFLNNPQRRANAINHELGQAQYNAPTALNVTQSSGMGFADFDAKGNLRTSNFSPYPQVTQGFTWTQTHGLFDGPPTFYNVPGGQKSQFGAAMAPPVVNHYYTIHAIDTQSFAEAMNKNHMAVSNAVAKGLQNAHGSLTAEVQNAARG
jgi:hypothetical protein